MRRFVAQLAMSADGFIARPDGAVDWLDRPWPEGAYGMPAFMASVDTIVMGRETFDFGRRHGQVGMPGKTTYVFSRTLPDDVGEGVVVVRDESPAAFAARLRAAPGKDVWVMGGAKLFAGFLDAGALDELMVHVVPVLIGEGIPLLSPARRTHELTLLDSERFVDGVVKIRWACTAAR